MAAAAPEVDREALSARGSLLGALQGLFGLLALQYLLGTWVNLFGTFPPGPPSLGSALVDGGDVVLSAHIALAIALLFLGLVAVAYSWSLPPPHLRYLCLLGFLSILLAAAGGVGFVYSGYLNNASSFVMALGFLLAFAFYGAAYGVIGRGPSSARRAAVGTVAVPEVP
jgi:hypothetical protein